jgi:hypothetical protein
MSALALRIGWCRYGIKGCTYVRKVRFQAHTFLVILLNLQKLTKLDFITVIPLMMREAMSSRYHPCRTRPYTNNIREYLF